MRRLLTVAAATVVAAAVPQAADAHVGLKRLSPRAGSAHDSVRTVSATFRGRITDAKLTVRTSGGRKVSGARRLYDGRRAVRVSLRRPGRGTFKASLSWLSPDGHVVDRAWSFRIR